MADLTPRVPHRPLFWTNLIFQLQELTGGQEIYLAGGAVRDALMNQPLKDIDLAAPGQAAEWARRIANHFDGDFFVLDQERDVGRALLDTQEGHIMIDVARFRGPDLLADLRDRDFTMNAMAVDLRGDLNLLIDPLGGEADIKAKILRACSEGAFANDPLRTLRAVRQSVQHGFRIEPNTLKAMRAHAVGLQQISSERFRDELIKLLALQKPAAALRVAESLGLLRERLPILNALHGSAQPENFTTDRWTHTLAVVEALANILHTISPMRTDSSAASFGLGMLAIQLDRFRPRLIDHINAWWPNERPHRALLVLAALLHDCGQPPATALESGDHQKAAVKAAGQQAQALALSSGESERMAKMLGSYTRVLAMREIGPLDIHRFWWGIGATGVDACLLALARFLAGAGHQLDQDAWLMLIERICILLEAYFERQGELIDPPPLLDGNALMQALKLAPGPIIGRLLVALREAQVQGNVSSTEEALALAAAYVERHGQR